MHVAVLVVLFAGVAVVVLSAMSALWLTDTFVRLHFIAPVGSVGAPLIGIALVMQNGIGLTSGLIALTVGIVALTGPAIGIAIGRAMAQRENVIAEEEPR
jgi:multisubunit Na+/H+ antiporter MnhG subunit